MPTGEYRAKRLDIMQIATLSWYYRCGMQYKVSEKFREKTERGHSVILNECKLQLNSYLSRV